MAGEFIGQEILAADKAALNEKVNGDLCPTEFCGDELDSFMSMFVAGDKLISHPIHDHSFERRTIALEIKRSETMIAIFQRGKPIGD